jgi:hypothetical protein
MVRFTIDQLRKLMDKKHNIRNMSVIAHVDHGALTSHSGRLCMSPDLCPQRPGTSRADVATRSLRTGSCSVDYLLFVGPLTPLQHVVSLGANFTQLPCACTYQMLFWDVPRPIWLASMHWCEIRERSCFIICRQVHSDGLAGRGGWNHRNGERAFQLHPALPGRIW